MATRLDAARLLTYRAAHVKDQGGRYSEESAMAKLYASEASHVITNEAVQIFGGFGFMRGYLVERLYRDNRVLSIGGGTTEIMNEIISKLIL